MRKLVIAAIVIIIGIFAVLMFNNPSFLGIQKENVDPAKEKEDLEKAQDLLNEENPNAALEIIQKYDHKISLDTEEGKEWLKLLITASVEVGNPSQLLVLYDFFPGAFENNEKASLFVAKSYLVNNQVKPYEKIREKWAGRETEEEIWLSLDSDKLLLQGKEDEAIKLLKSKQFNGKQEANRLVRLAVLTISTDANQSWKYLTEAMKNDPDNPYIRLYRARLLEAAGKLPLAMAEYISAYQIDRDNLLLLDQLGNFFVRNGQYDQALEVWSNRLTPPTSDPFWVKAYFWNKVVKPVRFQWKKHEVPEGTLEPFVNYLINLPKDSYWDQEAFQQIPDSNKLLVSQQAAFWLRLIDVIKNGEEEKALELLSFSPFKKSSWAANLERGLRRILTYRTQGSFIIPETEVSYSGNPNEDERAKEELLPWQTDFFTKLDELGFVEGANQGKVSVPEKLENLLKSNEVFTAAFLAAGWREAALHLNTLKAIPDTFPDWIPYGLTQAYRYNRGLKTALHFAQKQPKSEALDVLIGELMIANKDYDRAEQVLLPVTSSQGGVGDRATWLISIALLDQNQPESAKKAIEQRPGLSEQVAGKEMLAKIALLQGEDEKAKSIYLSIVDQSDEAKSYLARDAFKNQDYDQAEKLTKDLLSRYPANPMLQENMKKISEKKGQ